MQKIIGTPSQSKTNKMPRWNRIEQARKQQEAKQLHFAEPDLSERERAKRLNVPRGTLNYWKKQEAQIDPADPLANFFNTLEGQQFLHRLLVALHITITQSCAAGIRQVCAVLEKSGLDRFVSASHATHWRFNQQIEEQEIAYETAQVETLSPQIPENKRIICLGEDETFHPSICLVAIEMLSNFIVLEAYADDRTAKTWGEKVNTQLERYPVTVNQGVSDEALALNTHITGMLQAHRNSDLFHILNDIAKGTTLPLVRQEKQAKDTLEKANKQLKNEMNAELEWSLKSPKPKGRPPHFKNRISQAKTQVVLAEIAYNEAQETRQQARNVLHNLSDACHPYDLESGKKQSTEGFTQRLKDCWDDLSHVVDSAQLSEKCQKHIDKAQRTSQNLGLSLLFFFTTIMAKIEGLCLSEEVEKVVYDYLIPAIYLQRVADKSTDREKILSLRAQSEELLKVVNADNSPIKKLSLNEQQVIQTTATDCANVFQRSSSCVEGRNGQLSLHHHARHRLSDRKLNCLTIIHNYWIKRPDGTTAAERFFGQRPDSLFDWLVEHTHLPGRPAKKRGQRKPVAYLTDLAT